MVMDTIPHVLVIPTEQLIRELQTKVFHDVRPRFLSNNDVSEWLWNDHRGDLRVQIFGPDVPPLMHNRDQLMITGSTLHQPITEDLFGSWNIAQLDEVIDRLVKPFSKESEA
jgi:hypothetical protein